jgi:hypothetical protein
MAIYRRSSRRPLIIVAVVAAVVGLALGFVLGGATAPGLASQISAARADATPIVTALEVARDEYPKLLAASAGQDAGGAPSAIARARAAFTAHSTTWAIIDPATTAALGDTLTKLDGLVAQKAPNDQVEAAVDAAQTLAQKLASPPAVAS